MYHFLTFFNMDISFKISSIAIKVELYLFESNARNHVSDLPFNSGLYLMKIIDIKKSLKLNKKSKRKSHYITFIDEFSDFYHI